MKKNSKKQTEEQRLLAEIEALIAKRNEFRTEGIKKFVTEYKESTKTKMLSDVDKQLFRELMEEISVENLIKIMELIDFRGADVNAREEKTDGTPLHFAMAKNDVPLIIYLIKKGANINFQNSYKTAPIHTGVFNKSYEAVDCLIKKGADLTLTQSDGFPPLHCAIIQEDYKMVKLLVEGGADLNSFDNRKDSYGTPLHWASTIQDIRIIEYLIEKGADLEAKDNSGKTPLNWAKNSENSKTFKILKEKGANYGE